MRFVLIDETLVSHGFWVKISGIDLKQFKRNPIMYWMHQRPSSYDGEKQTLPIGKWADIKKEEINGIEAITAEAVFDEKDEFAVKIKNKVEGGFINMASAGLMPITWSEEKELLKPGQTRQTLLKSEMQEASIVDRGANKNAVRLYNPDGTINLNINNADFIPEIPTNKSEKMKQIAILLGLFANAEESEILSAIEKMKTDLNNKETALQNIQKARVEKLMEHESITPENKEHFEELAKVNFGLAEKTLEIMRTKEPKAKPVRLSEMLNGKSTQPKADKEKSWRDYSEKELAEMREAHRDVYCELFNTEFGYFPTLD